MTFFQIYANVTKPTTEQRKVSSIARRVPKRIRTMMKPGPCVTFKPEAKGE